MDADDAAAAELGWSEAELSALAKAAQGLARRLRPDAALDECTPAVSASHEIDPASVLQALERTATRLEDNYPYHHPLYAGQMLKPPHPVARLAYALALTVNPNNHALDGGRASSRMEREAVSDLARMLGWRDHLGHLTSGGTVANLEALWVAGREHPGRTVLASDQAHYTHARISAVLGLPFDSVASDSNGRIDLAALQRRLAAGDVGCVVATAGTTGYGAVDPIDAVHELCREAGARLHVDAAYGGYFTLLRDAEELPQPTRAAFAAIGRADSVVIDPHKHGLQPYGCGAVLFADPEVGRHYRHDSPYTYFSSQELHLGEISLECSRAGAAAVALWATHQVLPPVPGGPFADGLAACRRAALELHRRLGADGRWRVLLEPELDIVVFAPRQASAEDTAEASRHVFRRAAEEGLHLALIEVPAPLVEARWPDLRPSDGVSVACLRSCLMKPQHEAWIERIATILGRCL